MRVPYLHISFIIECECKELVESGDHLPKIEKKQSGQLSRTDQNGKIGQYFTDEESNLFLSRFVGYECVKMTTPLKITSYHHS